VSAPAPPPGGTANRPASPPPRGRPGRPGRPPRLDPHFKRTLRGEVRQAEGWDRAVDGRAPRLGPDETIADGITRVGIFSERDPLRFPKLWTRVRFLSLALWAGVVGGSLYKAWRDHGGLPRADDDA
jgi:hypothetical protein